MIVKRQQTIRKLLTKREDGIIIYPGEQLTEYTLTIFKCTNLISVKKYNNV